ncbi:GTPase [Atopomonas sediminilitoris]|uniref:GTPase n=1 Tax=Atopomonas sediminilitoris TaxID=2919919 RepID=UPI001F4D6E05|nr:GTPase [Atopomonas sediminilitoris]MCJ8170056.1 GTPase [Atopomonas sediminilitoris]
MESLPIILENQNGEQQATHTARLGVRLNDRDVWLESDGKGGVIIYAEAHESEEQIPVLVVRPQAVNQLNLQVAMEAADDGDDCLPGCGCDDPAHSH